MAYPRFRFDQRFDPVVQAANEPEPVEEEADPLDLPSVTEREAIARVQAAEWRSFAEGVERGRGEGEETARNTIEAETAQALVLIADKLADLDGRFEDSLRSVEDQGTAVMVALVRRLAPGLIERVGRAAVERLAIDALRAAGLAPVLKIRVHPDLAGPVRVLLDRETPQAGFAGAIDVTPDPALDRHALDAAWESGGVRYDPAAFGSTVADLCDQALAALDDPSTSTARRETTPWHR
jgi:flagellar assembly protein FliH